MASAPGMKGKILASRKKKLFGNKTKPSTVASAAVKGVKTGLSVGGAKKHKSGIVDLGHQPSEARIDAANARLRKRKEIGLGGRATTPTKAPAGLGASALPKAPKIGGSSGSASTGAKIRPVRPAESAGSVSRGGEGSSSTATLRKQESSGNTGFAKGIAAGVVATAVANKISSRKTSTTPKVRSGTGVHPGSTTSSAPQTSAQPTAKVRMQKAMAEYKAKSQPSARKRMEAAMAEHKAKTAGTTSVQEGGAKTSGAGKGRVVVKTKGAQPKAKAPTPKAPEIKVAPAPSQGVKQPPKGPKAAKVQPASETKAASLEEQVAQARKENQELKAAKKQGKAPKVNVSQPDVSSGARAAESPSKAGIDETVAKSKPIKVRVAKKSEGPAAAAKGAAESGKPVATAAAPKSTGKPKVSTEDLKSQLAEARAENERLKAGKPIKVKTSSAAPAESAAGQTGKAPVILRKGTSKKGGTPLPVTATPSKSAPPSVSTKDVGAEQRGAKERIGPGRQSKGADEIIAKVKKARRDQPLGKAKGSTPGDSPGSLTGKGRLGDIEVEGERIEAKSPDPGRKAQIEAFMKKKGYTEGPSVADLRKAHQDYLDGKINEEEYKKRLGGRKVGAAAARKKVGAAAARKVLKSTVRKAR